MSDCVECGHPFDPTESASFEVCRDCLAFMAWFFGEPFPVDPDEGRAA